MINVVGLRHVTLMRTLILGAALCPALLVAQAPWTVVVVPTRDPLPIGGCAQVRLQVIDATGKDTPRSPKGAYVTMADFDMTVTAANPSSVAGQYDGAASFSACACQGAAVGAVGTVTATYPAKSLPANARVRGTAFQSSATFALARAYGTSDPPSCGRARQSVAATAGGAASAGVSGGAAGGASAASGGAAGGAANGSGGSAGSAAGAGASGAGGAAAGGAAGAGGAAAGAASGGAAGAAGGAAAGASGSSSAAGAQAGAGGSATTSGSAAGAAVGAAAAQGGSAAGAKSTTGGKKAAPKPPTPVVPPTASNLISFPSLVVIAFGYPTR